MAPTERKQSTSSGPRARIVLRRRRTASALERAAEAPPPSVIEPAPTQPEAGPDAVAAPGKQAQPFAGSAVLLGDLETTFALLNHGRRLAIARLFGVEGRDADIVTLIGLALLAQSAREGARKLGSAPLPSGADAFLGFAAAREAIMGIAGPITREMPGVPAFILIAVLGAAAGPTLAKTLQRLRSGSQRMNSGFHHRYGYLVDPGHRRQHRADRRDRAVSMAVPANRQPSR